MKCSVCSQVHIKSRFILNGVCVRWRGWLDQDRLDGVGCVEFDEEAGRIEDVYRREQVERFNQRLREFEEDQRAYRNHHHPDRQTEQDLVDVGLFLFFGGKFCWKIQKFHRFHFPPFRPNWWKLIKTL